MCGEASPEQTRDGVGILSQPLCKWQIDVLASFIQGETGYSCVLKAWENYL